MLSLPSIHHQNLQIPANYKYFSPQTYNKSQKQQQLSSSTSNNTLPRYPFHKNRAISRTNQTNQIFYKNYIPTSNSTATIRNSKFYLDLRSTSSDQSISSVMKEVENNTSTEFDPMLANHLNYRTSKRNLQQTNSIPYRNKQRYSNFYEYNSYNKDLNSISEDSGSDT